MKPNLQEIDVAILCGGLGTRLRSTIGEKQKTMAEVNGQPFLDILLEYLARQGFKRVVLCAGFQSQGVAERYSQGRFGLKIAISAEDEPLGTGGAIKNARSLIKSETFLVLNGDCFCELDYAAFVRSHIENCAQLTLAVVRVKEKNEYGSILMDNTGRILNFQEKVSGGSAGLISAGIYCCDQEVFSWMPDQKTFMLEKDFFPHQLGRKVFGFETSGKFLDIGTPQRLAEAQSFFQATKNARPGPQIVDPNLYSREYYLTDNEGCKEYELGLDEHIHPKFRRALELAMPQYGERVLDIGCGRGELVYYCAKRGCVAQGLDYSADAIAIAQQTLGRLPKEVQSRVAVAQGDVVAHPLVAGIDVVFMVDIVEHMYDWQLEAAFKKIYALLSPRGRLIITTPNDHFEKILLPAKKILNMPLMPFKWGSRVLRKKYQPKSFAEFWRKCFRFRCERGSLADTHVNVLTPSRLKNLLKDFAVQLKCDDHSVHPLSLLTAKWWGREIVVVARRKAGEKG